MDASASIVAGAISIACEAGIGGVTARAVAARTNVSPSSVIYHYKSIAGLLNAIQDALGKEISGWRHDTAASLTDPATKLFSVGGLMSATVMALTRDLGLRLVLQQELQRAASRGLVAIEPVGCQRATSHDAFWQALLRFHDTDSTRVAVRGLVAEGLVPLMLLDRVAFRRDALISAVIQRLEDRLARRSVAAFPYEQPVVEMDPIRPVPQGKRRIIDAAVQMIGRDGLHHLTHRKVAAEAGVSLAATTYFYATKDDLIADAFRDIQRRSVQAVVQAQYPRQQFMSAVLLNDQEEERWEISAMLALYHAALRFPRYQDLALVLRQLRGIDGMRWLQAQGCGDADHLDGILWSAATTTIGEQAFTLPQGERRAYLDRESEQVFHILFGE